MDMDFIEGSEIQTGIGAPPYICIAFVPNPFISERRLLS